MVSTQHSALSTQHSALSTQHSALSIFFRIECYKILFGCLLISTSFKAHSSCANGFYLTLYYSSETTALYSTKAEACNAFGVYVANRNDYILESSLVVDSQSGYDIPDPDGQACNVTLRERQLPQNGYTILNDIYGGAKCPANPPPTLIGYFNGVANTRATALISRDRLQREYGATYKSKPLEYELFYNQTTCELGAFRVGKIPCLEDIAEVFEQRSSELNSGLKNRWEHFWEMLSGRTSQDGSLTATLTSKLGKFGQVFLQLLDNIYALIINQFVGSFPMLLNSLNGTPTLNNNAAHLIKLKTYADKGSGLVLIAHSQGNLFVNAAYDGLKTAAPAAKVQVVHIAPASPTLRGGYALADVDYVIRTLRQLVTGLPSFNIELPLSANDRTGHSFEGTYLDVSRKAYERVKTMINTALDGV